MRGKAKGTDFVLSSRPSMFLPFMLKYQRTRPDSARSAFSFGDRPWELPPATLHGTRCY